MFLQKLYVRIWFAVVFAVAVLTLLVGWAWHMTAEAPLRKVVVRDADGLVIGKGVAHGFRASVNNGWRLGGPAPTKPAQETPDPVDTPEESDSPEATDAPSADEAQSGFGAGPEFVVRMSDGQTLHLHMPRPLRSAWRAPFGFFWTLGLVAVAVALATYPIVRQLTRRLERLQVGVQRWGDGDLGARVSVSGQDEVGFLAERFNHAAQQIETLVKSHQALLASQKSLLANASHELRSPLARIRMGLELLGSGGQTQDKLAQDTAMRGEISRNIAELDMLIEEILLASRLDAREADLGTIESVDLVGLAAEECARTHAGLEVEQAELPVPGVAKLLRRAVRNLLENARRYAAGEVSLVLQRQGTEAVIQVRDNGPGVPEAYQLQIFEPFYRLPGSSERDGGVGLGLALVKSIAERHHGRVRCSNRPEGGACFEIRLPLEV